MTAREDPAPLRQTIAEQREHLDALAGQATSLARQLAKLRGSLTEARRALAERDAEIEDLRTSLAKRGHELGLLQGELFGLEAERDRELAAASAGIERLRSEIAFMQATRVWRLGSRFWRLRDVLRRTRP